ncbi:MAG: acetolactate synthase small subunit [Candidatus Saganbacteria bacterium]|nr:acetolactate synthase small subunit [Candidatus Saganbacteria bacterium]
MKHTIAVLVNNRPGVLSRVAGLFSRRGFNIESLAVGTTEDENVSRMTIVVSGDESVLEQITKQLYKLIDVIKVYCIPPEKAVERELVLIKVSAETRTRPEIMQIVDLFRGRIVDVSEDSIIIEMTDEGSKIEGIEKLLQKFGIKELVRTGKIALERGVTESR